MRVVLKGVHAVKKTVSDGSQRIYYYAWRGGPRLLSEPGTPDFMQEFAAKTLEARAPAADTVAGLVAGYKASPEYINLAKNTTRGYDPWLAKIAELFGDMPIIALEEHGARTIFKEWRNTLATRPRQADMAWSVIRRVFSWALDGEKIKRNPCTRGGRLYNGSRADIIWTDDQISTVKQKCPDRVKQALMLALWTGQRQGDLLALKWSAYDGTHIRLMQSKTRKRVAILVYSELKVMLDTMERTDAETILTNTFGRPWTSDGFKTTWQKEIKKAGIKGVTFHDLRGTFVTAARRAGSTVEQISAASGHSNKDVTRILEAHYLAYDEATNDAVIMKLEKSKKRTKL